MTPKNLGTIRNTKASSLVEIINSSLLKTILGASLIVNSLGCVSAQKGHTVSELRVSNTEDTNTSFFYQAYVQPYKLTRYIGPVEEAERRMMDEALETGEEDQWLWYERDGKSYFVDVGKSSQVIKFEIPTEQGVFDSGIVMTSVLGDERKKDEIVRSLPSGTKIRFYHTHPFTKEDRTRKLMNIKEGTLAVENMTGYLEHKILESHLPSYNDFRSDFLERRYYQRLNPGVTILPSRIVGVMGCFDYMATEEQLLGAMPYLPEGKTDPFMTELLDYNKAEMIKKLYFSESHTINREAKSNSISEEEDLLLCSILTRHNWATMFPIKSFDNPSALWEKTIQRLNVVGLKVSFTELRRIPKDLRF